MISSKILPKIDCGIVSKQSVKEKITFRASKINFQSTIAIKQKMHDNKGRKGNRYLFSYNLSQGRRSDYGQTAQTKHIPTVWDRPVPHFPDRASVIPPHFLHRTPNRTTNHLRV